MRHTQSTRHGVGIDVLVGDAEPFVAPTRGPACLKVVNCDAATADPQGFNPGGGAFNPQVQRTDLTTQHGIHPRRCTRYSARFYLEEQF